MLADNQVNVSSLQEEMEKRSSEDIDAMASLFGEYVEEETLVLIKPESLERALIGKIIARIEEKGLRIISCRTVVFDRETFDAFYPHIVGKPYYQSCLEKMMAGVTICMIVKGHLCIRILETMKGATDPLEALPGTIRGDFGVSLEEEGNLIHSSDSKESYLRETQILFPEYAL